jgi:hypothetical protein
MVILLSLTINAQNLEDTFPKDSAITYPSTIIIKGDTVVCYTLNQELFLVIERLEYINKVSELEGCIDQNFIDNILIEDLKNQYYNEKDINIELKNSIMSRDNLIGEYIDYSKTLNDLNGILEKERKKYKRQRDIIIVGGVTITVGVGALLVWSILK